jgi:hypothetical protein
MGPPIKKWNRDLEIEEKRNLPDWSQTHGQFSGFGQSGFGHGLYAPNNPKRQTTVPVTDRLLREPAGSENDRLKEIVRVFKKVIRHIRTTPTILETTIFEHKTQQMFEQLRRWRTFITKNPTGYNCRNLVIPGDELNHGHKLRAGGSRDNSS